MGTVFGKTKESTKSTNAKTATISSKDRAVLDLKIARDKLNKFQKQVCLFGDCTFIL